MPLSAAERGSLGGRVRMANQTPEQRKELARKAARAAAVTTIANQLPDFTPEQIERLRSLVGGASR